MLTLRVRNVHEALPKGVDLLWKKGVRRDSRAGEVIVSPEPVTTIYERPKERVIFHAKRDANPFFHMMESLWMLAGRRDVEFVSRYVKRMKDFSDDGIIFNGAYGHRWRHRWGRDQINTVVSKLKTNPDDRRIVMSIWDPSTDFDYIGKDTPCNTHIYFGIAVDGRLDMTVCNRSNDIIWGAYGANAVHLSVLQEYIAEHLGVEVGVYRQMSNNYHAYTEVLEKQVFGTGERYQTPYVAGNLPHTPLGSTEESWQEDLTHFLSWAPVNTGKVPFFKTEFFRETVVPMEMVHYFFRLKQYNRAIKSCEQIEAVDWRVACTQWIQRRHMNARKVAEDDGVNYEQG